MSSWYEKVEKKLPIYLSILLVVGLMVGASEVFKEKEILFPEIGAIAVGSILAPKMAWRTSKIRIVLFIALCAVGGVAIVKYCPGGLTVQMILAYLIAQIIFLLSKTSFAPMISAMVLPVLLQVTSPVYLMAAPILTILIMALRLILEKAQIREENDYIPVKRVGEDVRDLVIRTLIAGAIIAFALWSGLKFMVAPPLLVDYTEFTNRGSAARKQPVKAVILLSLSALFGSAFRYLLCLRLGFSATMAVLLAMLLTLCVVELFGMYIPPAGALCALAFLIPEDMVFLYPLHALLGISVLMASALLFFQGKKGSIQGY